jgi:hypothetical protein
MQNMTQSNSISPIGGIANTLNDPMVFYPHVLDIIIKNFLNPASLNGNRKI